eukprot:CAMPEP_0196586852 /NCGR_PEP_ID=MMETSP1081-20130531/55796_1 /TAXON_ID=36882 /ORGANISM="Pyramimonas amylifera, Strain CCMP720" /LENGTH=426 /DNA_ID=CAMNT_0041908865 /DNA_START=73 /DNA_END=1353 /DNA_ORIENTATION=+
METDPNEIEPKILKLVGFQNFKRSNPYSDKFEVQKFHHLDFWCSDANNTYRRFAHGLGMQLVAQSDQSTGNHSFASYVLKSGDTTFCFTAPYSAPAAESSSLPLPFFDKEVARAFTAQHGLGIRAVGIQVSCATSAYVAATAGGGIGVTEPHTLEEAGQEGSMRVAEVVLYGDAVLRFVSYHGFEGPFLPKFNPATSNNKNFGIQRIDHVVGNVPELVPAVNYIANMTGFHEFAEFIAKDVGTLDSGLNSMVLACNNESVLLPVNEPTFGTNRKSQIQTYLEQFDGPGVQHIALKTDDIFSTVKSMRDRTHNGGFDFMPSPADGYYQRASEQVGVTTLTETEFQNCKELGILVDKDDQGVLLQIFTKPLGDRPTVFIEIIQRVGCMLPSKVDPTFLEQAPGCGGFGKGNFHELFKSIEDYERTLDV